MYSGSFFHDWETEKTHVWLHLTLQTGLKMMGIWESGISIANMRRQEAAGKKKKKKEPLQDFVLVMAPMAP